MQTNTSAIVVASIMLMASLAVADDSAGARRAAVAKSLPLLRSSPATYVDKRECFSCHHQALPTMALHLAAGRGFKVDAKQMRVQSKHTIAFFKERRGGVAKGKSVPGGPYTTGYALVALAADDWGSDDTTDAMVAYLLRTQEKNGRWRIRTHRPPLEDSDFTATALTIRGLQHFGAKAKKDDTEQRIARARKWLIGAKPKTNEDRTFRLFALKWAGADGDAIKSAARDLLADQRDDGGWRQIADRPSDAYATGQALVALHQAGGVPTDHDAYRRGVAFLLKTQRDDGSWLVETRSRPIQTYFESGFPHGKHQFISICGTSWATMAVALTLPADEAGQLKDEAVNQP